MILLLLQIKFFLHACLALTLWHEIPYCIIHAVDNIAYVLFDRNMVYVQRTHKGSGAMRL